MVGEPVRLRRCSPFAAYADVMPSTVSPRGPLPSRVYWTRRLFVLGLPLLLVVVLARVVGASSDAKDPGQGGAAAQTGATIGESAPVPAVDKANQAKKDKRAKKRKRRQKQKLLEAAEPVLAEPTGPCANDDIVATAQFTSVPLSEVPMSLTLALRTVETEACTWQAGADTVTISISSGNDDIWSARECPAAIPVQDVVVRREVDTPITFAWDTRRSDETCSASREWAKLGWYHLKAAALGGEATDVQFELVAPPRPVITRTAEPVQQGGKGKKRDKGKKHRKDGDSSHQPGEDGAGNSEG